MANLEQNQTVKIKKLDRCTLNITIRETMQFKIRKKIALFLFFLIAKFLGTGISIDTKTVEENKD